MGNISSLTYFDFAQYPFVWLFLRFGAATASKVYSTQNVQCGNVPHVAGCDGRCSLDVLWAWHQHLLPLHTDFLLHFRLANDEAASFPTRMAFPFSIRASTHFVLAHKTKSNLEHFQRKLEIN